MSFRSCRSCCMRSRTECDRSTSSVVDQTSEKGIRCPANAESSTTRPSMSTLVAPVATFATNSAHAMPAKTATRMTRNQWSGATICGDYHGWHEATQRSMRRGPVGRSGVSTLPPSVSICLLNATRQCDSQRARNRPSLHDTEHRCQHLRCPTAALYRAVSRPPGVGPARMGVPRRAQATRSGVEPGDPLDRSRVPASCWGAVERDAICRVWWHGR